MKTTMPTFEGRAVHAGALKLTGKADERIGSLDYDEEVYLLVRARITKVSHEEVTKDGVGLFARIHTANARSLVIVDPNDGERMLDEAAMLADERFGVASLFGGGDGPRADPETGEIGG